MGLGEGFATRPSSAARRGTILEIENTGEIVQITDCNFDRRCANLSKP